MPLTSPRLTLPRAALAVLPPLLAACAVQLHEPAVDHDAQAPWQIHCETARTYGEYTEDVPGAARADWVFAQDAGGAPFTFEGQPVD